MRTVFKIWFWRNGVYYDPQRRGWDEQYDALVGSDDKSYAELEQQIKWQRTLASRPTSTSSSPG